MINGEGMELSEAVEQELDTVLRKFWREHF